MTTESNPPPATKEMTTPSSTPDMSSSTTTTTTVPTATAASATAATSSLPAPTPAPTSTATTAPSKVSDTYPPTTTAVNTTNNSTEKSTTATKAEESKTETKESVEDDDKTSNNLKRKSESKTEEDEASKKKKGPRKHPKAPPTKPSVSSTLVPVRIDVTSTDNSGGSSSNNNKTKLRIVDTLLIDPTCFPIPLYSPIAQAVEDNVRQLAYDILADSETLGMTRSQQYTTTPSQKSTKHSHSHHSHNQPEFVGRIDVWSKSLQTKVENQLRPQLWKIVDGTMEIISKASERTTNAAKSIAAPASAPTSSVEGTTKAPTNTTANDDGDGQEPSSSTSSSLVPISIRLYTIHRIIIYEDILWDPINSPLTVFEFAQELANDLNLPAGDEAAIGITTCMLEQLYGLPIDTSPDGSAKVTQQIFYHNHPTPGGGGNTNNNNVVEASSSSKEGLRGAYQMSENNNRNSVSQFSQQHRIK